MSLFGSTKAKDAKKARKLWEAILLQAQQAQRSGQIQEYASLMSQAADLEKTVVELECT